MSDFKDFKFGRWMAKDDQVLDEFGNVICTVRAPRNKENTQSFKQYQEQNRKIARLISAAPEMLELIQTIYEDTEGFHNFGRRIEPLIERTNRD
jgi:hypothetical protein